MAGLSKTGVDGADVVSVRRVADTADHVSGRVAEPGSDFRRIGTNGLRDLASVGYDSLHRRSYAVDHNVNQKAWRRCRQAPEHPRAADLADGVVEGGVTVSAFSELPEHTW